MEEETQYGREQKLVNEETQCGRGQGFQQYSGEQSCQQPDPAHSKPLKAQNLKTQKGKHSADWELHKEEEIFKKLIHRPSIYWFRNSKINNWIILIQVDESLL